MTMKQKYKLAYKHSTRIQTINKTASPEYINYIVSTEQYIYIYIHDNELPLSMNCNFARCMRLTFCVMGEKHYSIDVNF